MKSQKLKTALLPFQSFTGLIGCCLFLVSCAGLAAQAPDTSTSKVTKAPASESSGSAPSASTPSEAPPTASTPPLTSPTFQGCDSPTPMSRTDRLAVLAKITLDVENELASEIEAPPGAASQASASQAASGLPPATPVAVSGTPSEPQETSIERRARFRERVGTFAAGSMPDTVPLVSMDRSCWASFYGAQQKLAEGDDIGALSESKEWKDCLEAMFPDRVALAKPYFSCFSSRSKKQKK